MSMSTSSGSAWYAALLSDGGPALVGIDVARAVTLWTSGAESLFGWTAAQVRGQPPPFIPPGLQQEWQLQTQRVLESGQPDTPAETQRLTRDGRLIWVLRSSTPVRGQSGQVIGLIDVLQDVTALKQVDEEARALVQVRERELIAMDLHDGLIQSLYATVLSLSARQQSLDPPQPQAVEALEHARTNLERVIEETRGYVFDLRARP